MGQQGSITVEVHSADAAIVSLHGEHDLESQSRVEAAVMAAGVRPTVLADLSACTFADSSVITVLLRAARTLAELGGSLDLMGVPAVLPLHDSRESALARLGAGARPVVLRRAA